MFIYISNFHSSEWPKELLQAVEMFGELKQIPSPRVHHNLTSEEVKGMAEDTYDLIESYGDAVQGVLVMGEISFSMKLVLLLKKTNIPVFAYISKNDRDGARKFVQLRRI